MAVTGILLQVALYLALAALLLAFACVLALQVLPRPLMTASRALARRRVGLAKRAVRIGRHRVVYLEGGSGDPVLLLHGFGANKDMWTEYARGLLQSYRVIAPDLPGFGDSDFFADERYGYLEQAERVRRLLDELGLERVHLGGNSMGGGIAGMFAALHPERTASLLLMDAAAIDAPKPAEFATLVEQGQNPLIVRKQEDVSVLLDFCFAKPPRIPSFARRLLASEYLSRIARNERIFADIYADGGLLGAALSRIRAPVLVVWGARDRVIDRSTVDVIARQIPHAKRVEYEDCGHLPCVEKPTRSARDHHEFLASAAAAPALRE